MNRLLSATGLAGLAWLSTFAMIWLVILQKITVDFSNVFFWMFFFVIALSSSSVAREGNRK